MWTGLIQTFHPTQALADFLPLQEQIEKPLTAIKLVYVGDASNNVAHSLMIAAAKLGTHFVSLAPPSLWPEKPLFDQIQSISDSSGATIEYYDHSKFNTALKDADAIYPDVWVSMGERQQTKKITLLRPYQVNQTN